MADRSPGPSRSADSPQEEGKGEGKELYSAQTGHSGLSASGDRAAKQGHCGLKGSPHCAPASSSAGDEDPTNGGAGHEPSTGPVVIESSTVFYALDTDDEEVIDCCVGDLDDGIF